MPKDIVPSNVDVKSLSKGEEQVLALLNMDGFGLAVAATQFDQMEWAGTLVKHVRDPDPKVSLSALREFRATMVELAKINGLITAASAEIVDKDEGRKIKRVLTQTRLVQKMQDDSKRLEIMKNVEGPKVIEPLPITSDSDIDSTPQFEETTGTQ